MSTSACSVYRDLARGYSIPSRELHSLVDAAWTAGRAEEFVRLRPLLRRTLSCLLRLEPSQRPNGLIDDIDRELAPSPAHDDREAAMRDLQHTRYRIKNNEARQRMKVRRAAVPCSGSGAGGAGSEGEKERAKRAT